MCSLCRLPVTKNHNFVQILSFGGLLYRPPFTNEGQIWCARADPRHTLTRQIFVSIGLFCRPLAAKTPNFAVFGLRHFVVSPIGRSLRKLNTGAQLQTFPYPTASKSFLYSNAFMCRYTSTLWWLLIVLYS